MSLAPPHVDKSKHLSHVMAAKAAIHAVSSVSTAYLPETAASAAVTGEEAACLLTTQKLGFDCASG